VRNDIAASSRDPPPSPSPCPSMSAPTDATAPADVAAAPAPADAAAAPAPALAAPGSLTIVVMGATGRQGGAVVKQLLRHPQFKVVGVTRHPDSAEAKALVAAHPTVTLRKADANDVSSLKAAFAGAHGVFGLTNPFASRWTGIGRPVDSVELEDRQGHNIVDAAKGAGVAHLVLSTTASAGDHTGIPTFEAKARVEAHLRASGVPHTIIAPVGFLENMESPFAGIRQGVVPGLLKQVSERGGGQRAGTRARLWWRPSVAARSPHPLPSHPPSPRARAGHQVPDDLGG
jgi:NAD(P)-dependent dehydrogenase (short-subunit alcohol dehydrogenase family)